jgi:hypothetical protein
MKDVKKVTMKNGKPATQGICTVCGTKMFKIGNIGYRPGHDPGDYPPRP